MNILEINELSKIYGSHTVVDRVSMHLPQGNIYGFLGLNGAGKTTTMRMVLGMIKPSFGSVIWFGQPLSHPASLWGKVGYMVESTHAYPNLTVEENLMVFFRYHGLRDKGLIGRIISLLQLEPYRTVRAKHLSLGNLQRLGLARALMHQPEVLILDEPVNGLDPSGIVEIRELLRELSRQGATILISSHLLTEIAKIADTIGIIHQGTLIRELKGFQLQQEIEQKLILDTHDNARTAALLQASGIATRPNERQELEIIDPEHATTPDRVASLIVSADIGLTKLFTFREDLESYFLRTISPAQA